MEHDLTMVLNQIRQLQAAAAKLAKLVASQQLAAQQTELDTLEAILKQKQVFIDELSGYRKLKAVYEGSVRDAGEGMQLQFAGAIQEFEETLAAISRAEEMTIRMLQERHADFGRQLRALTQNRQAANSYNPPGQSSPKSRVDISS